MSILLHLPVLLLLHIFLNYLRTPHLLLLRLLPPLVVILLRLPVPPLRLLPHHLLRLLLLVRSQAGVVGSLNCVVLRLLVQRRLREIQPDPERAHVDGVPGLLDQRSISLSSRAGSDH